MSSFPYYPLDLCMCVVSICVYICAPASASMPIQEFTNRTIIKVGEYVEKPHLDGNILRNGEQAIKSHNEKPEIGVYFNIY